MLGDSSAARAEVPEAAGRDVRDLDGEVEWRCPRCDTWSPLLAERCTACGGQRTGFGDRPPQSAATAETRRRAVAASIALPGLGHLLAGRTGTGLARLLLAICWLLGGVALARAAAGSDASPLPAVPLLLGVVLLWAGSIADAASLDAGREILRPRVLGALTLAVVGTLILALVAAIRP